MANFKTRYSLGDRTSNGTNAEAAWELIAGATRPFIVEEIQVTLAAATATHLGLGRPAAKGITPTTPVTLKAMDSAAGAAVTATALAWATKPTIPAAFLRKIAFAAVIGESVTWKFENGLIVPAAGSLILWNLAANGVLDVNVVGQE